MAKIKLSKLRFIPIIDVIYEDFDLTSQQAHVHGYLWNHCMNLNNDGWCGYSDERIAKDLKLGVRTLQRELEVLKNKNLISVENPGKRTKKTGQSRMIHLNTEYFIDDVAGETDLEKIELKKENARLRAELERVSAIAQQVEQTKLYPSLYVQMLIDAKIIPQEEIAYACATLDDAYNAIKAEFNANKVLDHIKYITNQFKSKSFKKPDNVVKYLQKAATNYYYRLVSDNKAEKKPIITQKPNNFDDDEQLRFDF